MSTIKSSDEHLTLNADGTSKDIKFQANGVEKASISSAGAFTSTSVNTGTIEADDKVTISYEAGSSDWELESTSGDDFTISRNSQQRLILDGSNGKLGMGIATPLQTLHLKQTARYTDIGLETTNRKYTVGVDNTTSEWYVYDDNATSFRMKINSAGAVTMPSQPAFSATKSGGNQTSTGVIVFNTVQTNIGSHYNNSNGRFTAPVAGQYYFSVFLMSSNDPSAFDVTFRKNGSLYTPLSPYFGDGPQYTQISGSAVVTLAANDYVDFELQATGGGQVYGSGPNGKHSYFSGFLIG